MQGSLVTSKSAHLGVLGFSGSFAPRRLVILFLSVCALALFAQPRAAAQQTIFNVPSATVTDKGKLFVQNEGQFRPYPPGEFYAGTQYQAVGIGANTELDLTMLNITAPSTHNLSMGVGAKSCIPIFKKRFPKRDYKITVGELLPIQLQGDQSCGSWTYAHVSGRLPKLRSRVTAGVSAGTRQIFGRDVVCFIGGFEHDLTKNMDLQLDWFSGRHSLGLFIPGMSYAFPRDYTLYAGFQIPNYKENGRTGFVIELAKILPLSKKASP